MYYSNQQLNSCRRSQFSALLLQHLESCGTVFTLMKYCFEKFQLFSFPLMLIQVKGVAEFCGKCFQHSLGSLGLL